MNECKVNESKLTQNSLNRDKFSIHKFNLNTLKLLQAFKISKVFEISQKFPKVVPFDELKYSEELELRLDIRKPGNSSNCLTARKLIRTDC